MNEATQVEMYEQPATAAPGGVSVALGEPKYCRTCGQPIYWCKHVESGKAAPIDAAADPRGNCVVFDDGTYSVLRKSDVVVDRSRLHTNHFQTCPQAAQHKKKG